MCPPPFLCAPGHRSRRCSAMRATPWIALAMNETNRKRVDGRIRVRRGAIAVLERGSSLLLIKRARGLTCAGRWCFPGGHVEAGETSRRAICRELAEELGINATPIERVGAVRVPTLGYVLVVWRVSCAERRFTPARDEVADLDWFTPQRIRSLRDGMASNECVLEMLGV